jgi:tRNA G10  N-methylase Trm11
MEYLIRLAQMHETFRRPELEALAVLHNVDLEILEYSDEVWQETFHFNLVCNDIAIVV